MVRLGAAEQGLIEAVCHLLHRRHEAAEIDATACQPGAQHLHGLLEMSAIDRVGIGVEQHEVCQFAHLDRTDLMVSLLLPGRIGGMRLQRLVQRQRLFGAVTVPEALRRVTAF